MVFFRKKHFLTELIQLDAIVMQIQESSTFFSKHQVSPVDHPLSTQGRFNRLSYIAWFGFLHLIFSIGCPRSSLWHCEFTFTAIQPTCDKFDFGIRTVHLPRTQLSLFIWNDGCDYSQAA